MATIPRPIRSRETNASILRHRRQSAISRETEGGLPSVLANLAENEANDGSSALGLSNDERIPGHWRADSIPDSCDAPRGIPMAKPVKKVWGSDGGNGEDGCVKHAIPE